VTAEHWDDDEPEFARAPLPPHERTWRHPSELGPMANHIPAAPNRLPRRMAVGVTLVGAVLGVGLVQLLAPRSGGSVTRVASRDITASTPEGLGSAPEGSTVDTSSARARLTSAVKRTRSMAAAARQSVSTLMVSGSGRAAVPVGDGRHAITTAGALQPGDRIDVLVGDGSTVAAQVITVLADHDIAVLELERVIANAVLRISRDAPVDGEHVSVGSRSVDAYVRIGPNGPVLEGGSSLLEGEPIVDDRGRLLGLVARGPDGSARIVTIPTLAALRSSAIVIDVWLGLSFETNTLRVVAIEENAPAARAGLQTGDVVRGINDSELRSIDDLWMFLAGLDVGDVVDLRVLREGIEQVLEVELASRPTP